MAVEFDEVSASLCPFKPDPATPPSTIIEFRPKHELDRLSRSYPELKREYYSEPPGKRFVASLELFITLCVSDERVGKISSCSATQLQSTPEPPKPTCHGIPHSTGPQENTLYLSLPITSSSFKFSL
jgi:hypothetical protein